MIPRSAGVLKPWVCSRLKAQALAELAVFGSLMILALGSLISYGLRYNQQQKLSQEAFRESLKIVSETDEDGNVKYPRASYTIIEDKSMPDPLNPFAEGSVSPISASSSVTRDWAMQLTPSNNSDLPTMRIKINNQELACNGISWDDSWGEKKGCTTAGFREENNVLANKITIDKYIELFGNTVEGCKKVEAEGNCSGGWTNIFSDGEIRGDIEQYCVDGEEVGSPEGGIEFICHQYILNKIRFIDNSAGEIMDYSATVRQCRQIVNVDFCVQECDKGRPVGDKSEAGSCKDLCAEKFNPPNQSDNSYDPQNGGAWYCAGYTEIDTKNHKYSFPYLDGMDSGVFYRTNPDGNMAAQQMGLLDSYSQEEKGIRANRKQEDQSKVTTTDNLGKETIINRTLMFLNPEKAGELSSDGIITESKIYKICPDGKSVGKDEICDEKITVWTTEK